tara:strand:+ start:3270 stop:3446 length:177 start_codon:yes stop_codon:yes gene_type:complete
MRVRQRREPTPCEQYSVNINKEDLINIYVKEWVLKWCKKYHPEAFDEAEKFVKNNLDN